VSGSKSAFEHKMIRKWAALAFSDQHMTKDEQCGSHKRVRRDAA